MAAHAELGGSGAARWLACPGSIRLSRQAPPEQESIYAAEGTVAHALAEQCVQQLSDPWWHLHTAPLPDRYPDIRVDEDMAEAVQVYVDLVLKRLALECGDRCRLELKLDVAKALQRLGFTPPPDTPMFGTADFIGVPDDDRLVVLDYKHGSGVPVDAKGNAQLAYYAVGALGVGVGKADRERITKVEVGICQPRVYHPDGPIRWATYSVDELRTWADALAAAARTAIQDDDAPLAAGPHCRWCPAAGFCPEIQRASLEKAKMVFSDNGDRIRPDKAPEELTKEELRVILDSASDIEAWLKRVREYAQHLIETDQAGPDDLGHKLVPKRAQRKWAKDQETVALRLTEIFGLGAEEMYEMKLRTPAQIEKTIGKEELKAAKDEFDSLVKKESSGHTLAPVSDPRTDKGAGQRSAKAAFTD